MRRKIIARNDWGLRLVALALLVLTYWGFPENRAIRAAFYVSLALVLGVTYLRMKDRRDQ